jgi:phosphoglycolate phosphatase-like HAD superfamily hydrolase
MKTIIFDIDGTLTDMWPIEKSVLLRMTKGKYGNKIEELKKSGMSDTHTIFSKVSGIRISKKKYVALYNKSFLNLSRRPKIKKYPIVEWIKKNRDKYLFVYATGGQKLETEYVLSQLGIIDYFDVSNSIHKNNCRFSKKSGIPFKKIKAHYKDCLLITDSQRGAVGAQLAGIPALIVKPGQRSLRESSIFGIMTSPVNLIK